MKFNLSFTVIVSVLLVGGYFERFTATACGVPNPPVPSPPVPNPPPCPRVPTPPVPTPPAPTPSTPCSPKPPTPSPPSPRPPARPPAPRPPTPPNRPPCGSKPCGPGGDPCVGCPSQESLCQELIDSLKKLQNRIKQCVCGVPGR